MKKKYSNIENPETPLVSFDDIQPAFDEMRQRIKLIVDSPTANQLEFDFKAMKGYHRKRISMQQFSLVGIAAIIAILIVTNYSLYGLFPGEAATEQLIYIIDKMAIK